MAKEKKVEQKEKKVEQKVSSFENFDSSLMVNEVKVHHAYNAVFGGKANDASKVLANNLRAQNPDLSKEDLVVEVYKGLGGLLDLAKAKKNRENDVKAKARKAKV